MLILVRNNFVQHTLYEVIRLNIGWWATSALEGNIGLNAIAQWVSTFNTGMPQGLGTGKVFSNNIESPLTVENGHLCYKQNQSWGRLS